MLSRVLWAASAVILRARAAGSGNISSAPFSIPPSQYFDGDDGSWSTFIVELGTPPQSVRLLPGTSAFAGTTIWVVLAEGCWEANPGLPNCANDRGDTFTRNQSTSWSTQRLPNGGLLQLNTFEEQYLGLTGSALYGFDTLTLGISGQNLPTLQNQLIAGIATDNYFLGSLGLSPLSFNISTLNDPVPSVLGNLRNESIVPSSSWGYTAGASYQNPPSYGSLTFGGYDKTRRDPNNTLSDIAFSGDTSRDLQLQLQSITYNTIGSTPLLTGSTYVFIDSTVSQIWLPLAACQNFEQAFNLTWNSSQQLYLIDEGVHNALLEQNPTFTFRLASSDGGTVDIVLPYAAFDLNVTLPILNATSRYFPLQRAQNSSQYTLGRVFLQEAYVIADYDRHNFTVSQALLPPASTPQQLVPICAPGNEAACSKSHNKLGGGAIAGIAVGSIVIALLIIAGLVWRYWRRRRREPKAKPATLAPGVDEKENIQPSEPFLRGAELDNRGAAVYEMDQRNEFRQELSGTGTRRKMRIAEQHEMDSPDVAAFELEAPVK